MRLYACQDHRVPWMDESGSRKPDDLEAARRYLDEDDAL